jgi:hypothetical protein
MRMAAESTINMPLPMTLQWLSPSPSSMSFIPTQPEVYVQRRELDMVLCDVLRADGHSQHGNDRTRIALAVLHDQAGALPHFPPMCTTAQTLGAAQSALTWIDRSGKELGRIGDPAIMANSTYFLYPPEIKRGDEVARWAGGELLSMGRITRPEVTMGLLAVTARVGGISGIRLRRNAGVAPRTGQKIETGTRVLCSHSALDRGGCRAGLRRH